MITDVFAYGTLKRGGCRHHWLRRGGIVRIEPAWTSGVLLHFGEYPGMVAGRGRVLGELVRLRSAAILRRLDQVEGRQFRRELIDVRTRDGAVRRAWAYKSNVTNAPRIRSGTWVG